MSVLIDTNILIRLDQPHHPNSLSCRLLAVQNLIGFWAVATRPAQANGLGLSSWERFVSTHQVRGKSAHDGRLVAVMNVNRIQKILTFNVQDFNRFDGIQVSDPRTVR